MNFFGYLGISEDEFGVYLDAGYVTEALHKEFPLAIYTYGRKTVHENKWDNVTSKCRGIIVNTETDEIVARPFEKFHNYGSSLEESTWSGLLPESEPTVIEKMDGFMCTMYWWAGKHYIASKGSFHSVHAKWATAELNKHLEKINWEGKQLFPGWTAVFEGLCRDLRIVVDYGQRQGLVLLAIINNETGEEVPPHTMACWGILTNISTPRIFPISLAAAVNQTRVDAGTEEGYVLTWYRTDCPPYRLKLKFTEYLRLHRLVTGVSPKRIWEALSQAHLKADLDEYINNSTPWFNKFVTKWITALRREYDRLMGEAHTRYQVADLEIRNRHNQVFVNPTALRKEYAEKFTKPENKEFSGILFAMLDAKDVDKIIWKQVRSMTAGANPMVDVHNC